MRTCVAMMNMSVVACGSHVLWSLCWKDGPGPGRRCTLKLREDCAVSAGDMNVWACTGRFFGLAAFELVV